jgi:hypothetical protein
MQKLLRVVLFACASIVALAFTGSALAAYAPRLVINHGTLRPTAADSTTIKITQTKEEDATARIAIYAPAGYTATLNQSAGTQIGTVTANVQATQIGADVIIPLSGTVVVADQSQAAIVASATACTGTATHAAVWFLSLVAANQPPLNVPIFVDPTAGQETALGAYKIVTCFSNPASTAFGAKLVSANFNVNGIFGEPATRGEFTWRGLFTPYSANNGVPVPASTVESRAILRIGSQLTLSARVTSKKKKRIVLSGTLSEFSSQIGGATVRLFLNGAKKASFTTKTSSTGKYAFALRNKSKKKTTTRFRAQAVVPDRDVTATGCSGTSVAPAGCVTATVGGFTALSPTRTVRI